MNSEKSACESVKKWMSMDEFHFKMTFIEYKSVTVPERRYCCEKVKCHQNKAALNDYSHFGIRYAEPCEKNT